MTAEIYMISCERYETLALSVASVCGHNACAPIHLIDDASTDPRIADLCGRLVDAGALASYERLATRSGVGTVRRRIVDRFLAGEAGFLVQIEGDMIVQPGGAAALIAAWRGLAKHGHEAAFLNTHNHDWCHQHHAEQRIGPYRVRLYKSNSEPFWLMPRSKLRVHQGLVMAERPDLVPYLQHCGATVLFEPALLAQHIGAVNSIYYPDFHWNMVTYRNEDGSVRQPFPDLFTVDFPHLARLGDGHKALYLDWAARVRAAAPVHLPEFP